VTDDNDDRITIEELNKVFKHAKNRKSCGVHKEWYQVVKCNYIYLAI